MGVFIPQFVLRGLQVVTCSPCWILTGHLVSFLIWTIPSMLMGTNLLKEVIVDLLSASFSFLLSSQLMWDLVTLELDAKMFL